MFWIPCPLRVIAFVGMFVNAWCVAAATSAPSYESDEDIRPRPASAHDRHQTDDAQAYARADDLSIIEDESLAEGKTQQAHTVDEAQEVGPANEEATGFYERLRQGEELTEDVEETSTTESYSLETESEEVAEDASDGEPAAPVGDHEDEEPASTEPEESVPKNVAEDENNAQAATCWVTKSGHSYHIDPACRAVRKSTLHEILLQEAEEKGYEPCGICAI